MLLNVANQLFIKYFYSDPHPFLFDGYTELNKIKCDRILRLVEEGNEHAIGLIAGITTNPLFSPVSAPFGGFHFRNNQIYIREIERYLNSLKSYVIQEGLKTIEIILPPDIYNQSMPKL